jgi:hypothetical protein
MRRWILRAYQRSRHTRPRRPIWRAHATRGGQASWTSHASSNSNDDLHDDPDDFAQLTELLLSTDGFDAFATELVSYAQTQTDHDCSITVRSGHRARFTVAVREAARVARSLHATPEKKSPRALKRLQAPKYGTCRWWAILGLNQ